MEKTVVIDIDGVLLDIMTPLEASLHRLGFSEFRGDNVLTYDWNRSFGQQNGCPAPVLGVPLEAIYSELGDVSLFKKAVWDKASLELIKSLATSYKGRLRFVIYSLSFTKDISDYKRQVCTEEFKGYDNISFVAVNGKDKKAYPNADAVVEDCLDNLNMYPDSCLKIIRHWAYNQEKYNSDYRELFPKCKRAGTTYQAINLACNILLGEEVDTVGSNQ